MDTAIPRAALETEKARIELELTDIGVLNPQNPNDWIGAPAQSGEVDIADLNDLADATEEQHNQSAIVDSLEVRFKEVNDAIERIDNGTYGTCIICEAPISEARLEANPAAATCINCA